jgi:c-di-GMP-binding flagellar brake protein YcgR
MAWTSEVNMKAPRGVERRRSERTKCVLKATYRLPDGKTSSGETRDISDGGVLLMVSGDIRKDDIIEMEISLGAGAEPLRARGRVVHTRPAGSGSQAGMLAGVAFLSLDERQQEALGKKIWHQILKESTRFGRE